MHTPMRLSPNLPVATSFRHSSCSESAHHTPGNGTHLSKVRGVAKHVDVQDLGNLARAVVGILSAEVVAYLHLVRQRAPNHNIMSNAISMSTSRTGRQTLALSFWTTSRSSAAVFVARIALIRSRTLDGAMLRMNEMAEH